ncbi:hypothetical protein D3C74_348580 [compost metagenome]
MVVALLAVAGPATLGAGDQVRVLALLGLATAVGMTVAGLLLLLAVRRHAGPEAVRGVPRTLAVLVVGVALGGAAGRGLSAVLLPDDAHVAVALAVGVGVALVAAVLVVGLALVADRSSVVGLARRGRGSAPKVADPS